MSFSSPLIPLAPLLSLQAAVNQLPLGQLRTTCQDHLDLANEALAGAVGAKTAAGLHLINGQSHLTAARGFFQLGQWGFAITAAENAYSRFSESQIASYVGMDKAAEAQMELDACQVRLGIQP